MDWLRSWKVPGSSGKDWTVSRHERGYFGCDCPAWKFQKMPFPDRRPCKHILRIARMVDDEMRGTEVGSVPPARYGREAAGLRVEKKSAKHVAAMSGLDAIRANAKWGMA